MAAEPRIAIVGSADPARATELGLRNPNEALRAAAELGAELARRGCSIVIYSFRPQFIETTLSQGYLEAQAPRPKSIRLIYPYANGEPPLGDCERFRQAFDPVPDRRPGWEISFYDSLKTVDGMVLIGGGQSTMVAGVISILDRRPILTLAGFGGSAGQLWQHLPEATITQDERTLMAESIWSHDSATRCVDALLRQRERLLQEAAERQRTALEAQRAEEKRRRGLTRESGFAAAVVVAAIIIAAVFFSSPPHSRTAIILLLFLVPCATGIAGAMLRRIFDDFRGLPPSQTPAAEAWALGLAAGGLTGVVYAVAQLTAFPDIKGVTDAVLEQAKIEHASKLLPTAMFTGFVAGLTLDAVFGKFIKKGAEPDKAGDGG